MPLSYKQVLLYTQLRFRLEKSLGLRLLERTISTDEYELIEGSVLPQLSDPTQPVYYATLWVIIAPNSRSLVGSMCFKGGPNSLGQLEIGYGIYPRFQRQGYMTEALRGLLDWVRTKPGSKQVLAETDQKNLASQAVLRKLDFEPKQPTPHTIWWTKILSTEQHTDTLLTTELTLY